MRYAEAQLLSTQLRLQVTWGPLIWRDHCMPQHVCFSWTALVAHNDMCVGIVCASVEVLWLRTRTLEVGDLQDPTGTAGHINSSVQTDSAV
jgi:hypothetical protein